MLLNKEEFSSKEVVTTEPDPEALKKEFYERQRKIIDMEDSMILH